MTEATTVTSGVAVVVAGSPSYAPWHALIYTVGLPAMALLVILVIEAVGSNDTRAVWLINAGSDMTIAALGMMGHLFGDKQLMITLGDYYAAVVMGTVLGVFFLVGISLHVRRTPYFMALPQARRVGLVVSVGCLSVVVVAFLATLGSWGVSWKN